MADEIVCETVEAFNRAVSTLLKWESHGDPSPGDSVTACDLHIVYRPPAPKPVSYPHPEFVKILSDKYVGYPQGSIHRAVAWTPGGNPVVGLSMTAILDTLDWFPAAPPPPRDAAREAFEGWLRTTANRFWLPSTYEVARAAFEAGRASVKP